ncbi:MAG TPA: alkaline phosphatase PhoX, partial [Acidimicrobiia bacterium]|nr:alkaline phosphatase PhoX [Acidimicrobiia bacterium]
MDTTPSLHEIVEARLSRRAVLGGAIGAAALGFLAPANRLLGPPGAGAAPAPGEGKPPSPLLGFEAVAPSTADAIVLPKGYTYQVLIPWGTPLSSNGPAWKSDASNTAAEQAQQTGMHHDGMHFFPSAPGPAGSRSGLLVLNHEYVDQVL